jgi:methyl-branched lipid omega-hydroxylase
VILDGDVGDVDLSDLQFWGRPWSEREAVFQALRRNRPIAHFSEPDLPGLPSGGGGYYAVTRYADIVEMSRCPELFCSGRGATSVIDMPPEMLEFYGSMINMDDPRHARLRGIVSATFTPRRLQMVLDDVERTAEEVITSVIDRGEADFAVDVAARLPLTIICRMMGIPASDYGFVLARSNIILSGGDPEFVPEDMSTWIAAFVQAGADLAMLMQDLAEHRMSHPTDDLTSALVNAEVDGERLSREELASFFILLVAAGNETTRTAISHGLLALSRHPEQRRMWIDDFDGLARTAVEEIVRWATPVICMRRTVTGQAEVSGQRFVEGDKVLLFYNSANRDEDVFEEPYRFDLRRDPNPHIAFGGPGPHFCLGAHLARREITVMFRELFRSLPDLEVTGEPAPLQSGFINGIKHLPVTFSPGGAKTRAR